MKQKYPASISNRRQRAHRSSYARPTTRAQAAAFPVSKKVQYRQTNAQLKWGTWPLTPGMAGLVAAIGTGAVAVGLLGSCNTSANAAPPCPVPTTAAAGTPTKAATSAATPIVCTTSSGSHYVWVANNGGWVRSDDGIHPNAGAHGVGEGDGSGDDGGDGHGGVGGHGGGDGGDGG